MALLDLWTFQQDIIEALVTALGNGEVVQKNKFVCDYTYFNPPLVLSSLARVI